MRHLAVDCGRYAVKVLGANHYLDRFPSYVGETRERRLINAPRDTDITLTTSLGTFFVGDLAKDESQGGARIMTANKIHQDTQLLIMAAVARAAQDGDAFVVTTGLPVEHHTPDMAEGMKTLLRGHFSCAVNDVAKRFSIDRVNIAVEGASAYATLCAGQGGVRRILDIGSRTVNYGTIIDGRYRDRESGTLDFGADTIGEPAALSRRIVAELSRALPDLNADTYLIGGGAILCATHLRPYFATLRHVLEPEWVNTRAFFEIGERAMRRA